MTSHIRVDLAQNMGKSVCRSGH